MQRSRIEALATPKIWRDVVSIMERTLPKPVSKAALHYKMDKTSRIWSLSKPKIRKINPHLHQKIKTHFNVDRNKNKYDMVSRRILELAEPKPEQRYIHETCIQIQPEKSYRRPYEKQAAWIKKNAVHKPKIVQPIVPKKYTKLSEVEQEEFFDRLGTIPELKRYKVITKQPKPKIKNLPDKMIASVNRLSEPRKMPSQMRLNLEYNPFEIPARALTTRASKRTLELAEPKIYETSAIKGAIRENPYEVSRSALKYKATKLIKKLAMPRQYNF